MPFIKKPSVLKRCRYAGTNILTIAPLIFSFGAPESSIILGLNEISYTNGILSATVILTPTTLRIFDTLKMFHCGKFACFCLCAGSLFRAQLRCWEARQVLEDGGPRKAFEVLQQAASSLGKVQDQTTESFKLTQGLFLYSEGEIRRQSRDYKKALECLQVSLDLTEELLKVDTNLARCYNAMGNCYHGLDKPQKALEYSAKALKMQEELSGGSERHYDMPVYKNQIGAVYEDQGEYDKAVECYKDALRLLEELTITGYEDEAVFCRNLANVYVRQKKVHRSC